MSEPITKPRVSAAAKTALVLAADVPEPVCFIASLRPAASSFFRW